MIVVAFNPDSRIETLLEASVLFTVNSMLRLSPAFAYTGFGLLVIIEGGGEDNLMIWTPPLTYQASPMAHDIRTLNGTTSITTATIGGSTYALVAA